MAELSTNHCTCGAENQTCLVHVNSPVDEFRERTRKDLVKNHVISQNFKDNVALAFKECNEQRDRIAALEAQLATAQREVAFWKDAPAAELPRLVVCAIIVCEGKILLEKRAPTGVDGLDGSWDLPGGKVEAQETPHQAVEREIYEEMGVRVRCTGILPEPVPSVWTYAQGKRHWLLVGCVCEIVEGEPKIGPNLNWFSGREFPENLLDADRRLIEDYMTLQRARDERDEALRLAQWTPITPENRPKDGDEVYKPGSVRAVSTFDPSTPMRFWAEAGWTHYRPITPPEVKP